MKPILLIIEGPTACGKSTLIAGLNRTLHLPVVHFPTPAEDIRHSPFLIEKAYGEPLRAKRACILDRWVYSNMAYGHVYGNQARCAPWGLERHALDAFRPLVVFLTAGSATLYTRIMKRGAKDYMGADVTNIAKLTELCVEFADIEKHCGLPKVGVRTDEDDRGPADTLADVLTQVNLL